MRFGQQAALGVALMMLAPVLTHAQDIGPAQEQELRDARGAIDAAQKSRADQYAASPLRQAQYMLEVAERARQQNDATRFRRSARLGSRNSGFRPP